MVENVDISSVAKKLNAEFEALIEERETVRSKSEILKKRAEEIERKLSGIQQTLQGFSLYTNAQEAPTQLMKKTTLNLHEMTQSMERALAHRFEVAGPDVQKTLAECCRDILRQRKGWMSAVQVRDALYAAKFDFSKYTSNPLSSIHTTLKRLAPDEVEVEARPDGQVYRWVNTPPGFIPINTPATSLKKR